MQLSCRGRNYCGKHTIPTFVSVHRLGDWLHRFSIAIIQSILQGGKERRKRNVFPRSGSFSAPFRPVPSPTQLALFWGYFSPLHSKFIFLALPRKDRLDRFQSEGLVSVFPPSIPSYCDIPGIEIFERENISFPGFRFSRVDSGAGSTVKTPSRVLYLYWTGEGFFPLIGTANWSDVRPTYESR